MVSMRGRDGKGHRASSTVETSATSVKDGVGNHNLENGQSLTPRQRNASLRQVHRGIFLIPIPYLS